MRRCFSTRCAAKALPNPIRDRYLRTRLVCCAPSRAIFGRSYAAEPDALVEEPRKDEAIAEGGTLLLAVLNQLGVGYNADVSESILRLVASPLAGADKRSNSDRADFYV
jgi:hypothetical protein